MRKRLASYRAASANAIAVTALFVAAVTVLSARRNEAASTAEANRMRPAAIRATVQDGLIGQHVALDRLVGSNSGDLDGREDTALIWLLDVTACPRCLLEVGEWNQLADSKAVSAFVVLTGPDSVVARIQHLARGLRSTAVSTASPSAVDGLVGRVLPNTKLLLSHQGVVLMADSRSSGQECGWSFEGQIAVLKGLASPEAIRVSRLAEAEQP